jgi:hypothetical protein
MYRYIWEGSVKLDSKNQFEDCNWIKLAWDWIEDNFYARLQNRAKRLLASSCLSVRLSVRLSVCIEIPAPNTDIFIKFYISIFFENLSRKFKFN